MEIKLGFLKGMQQDISPVKRDPDSYFSALNMRVIVGEDSSTGSITNDYGNELSFRIPALGMSMEILSSALNTDTTVTINGSGIIIKATVGYTTIDTYYEKFLTFLATPIAQNKVRVFNNKTSIKIIGLDPTTIITTTAKNRVLAPTNYIPVIVGYGTMRDSLILFTACESSSNYGQIWKLDYDFSTNSITGLTTGNYLVASTHLKYVERLAFDSTIRVGEIITKYNNPKFGKIYWSKDTLRHINLLDENVLGLPLHFTSLLPNVKLEPPIYNRLIDTGNLKSGMIQYAYQLYNYGGAETSMSGSTPLIHLVSNVTSVSDYGKTYLGDEPEVNTNKSVEIKINNPDITFDYIKVWSVFYSQQGSPVINLVYEDKIILPSMIIVDSGNVSLDTLTQAEFTSYGGRLFTSESITVKDNYLIPTNIVENIFDLDTELGYHWDARAYRWKDISGTYKFRVDGTDYTSTTAIAEKANATATDTEYNNGFKYKKDSIILGGTGTNIDYEFITLDTQYTPGYYPIDMDRDIPTGYVLKKSERVSDYYDNKSTNEYNAYSSCYDSAYLAGYCWEETYRFGIEIFDDKGRRSFVKWIGDIKFPTPTELGKNIASTVGNVITSTILGIKFNITTTALVSKGYSYRIVRVKREDADKSVITTAALKNVIKYNSGFGTIANFIKGFNTKSYLGVPTYNISMLTDHFVAVSPEITFKKVITLNGSTCRVIGSANTPITGIRDATSYTISNIYSIHHHFTKQTSIIPHTITDITITDSIQLPISYRGFMQLNGSPNQIYNSTFDLLGEVPGTSKPLSRGGRGILFNTNTALVGGAYPIEKGCWIANFYIDKSASRYGGNTYTARSRNDYIPCSKVIFPTTTSISTNVFMGDTYTQMFDYQCDYDANSNESSVDKLFNSNTVFIPLPSTINTALRLDTCVSRTTVEKFQWMIQDNKALGAIQYAEREDNTIGQYPTTFTDLYKLNEVYNMENTTVRGFTKPFNFVGSFPVDYRILTSQPSIPNEFVDNWTKYYFNDYLDLDSQHGAIKKVLVNNSNLLVLQENALAVVGFKDKSLLQTQTEGQLVLGVGSILSYYRYISTKTGTRNKWSVVELDNNIVWFDTDNRKLIRLSREGLEVLSDNKNMNSFFKKTYPKIKTDDFLTGVHGAVSKRDNRIYFTFLNGIDPGNIGIPPNAEAGGTTISYNLLLGQFESFHSFVPKIFLETELGLLSIDSDKSKAWIHGATNYTSYYGVNTIFNLTTIAGEPINKKSWTNVEFNSDDISPTTISYSNSYGNAFSTSLTRRFRTYRTAIPRQDSSNQRFVDYYLKCSFNYLNSTEVVRLDDITLKYLIPLI